MNKYVLMLLVLFVCAGCSHGETTVPEAFKKHHKHNSEALFTRELTNSAVVFYKHTFDNGSVGLGTAVFKREKSRWRMISSSAGHYDTDVSLQFVRLPPVGPESDLQYGLIGNHDIQKVELVDHDGHVQRADIVKTSAGRIWYIIGEYKDADLKAYSADGAVVLTIPERY